MADRLLLIEDDQQLAAMLSEYLGPMGFEVSCARCASDALEALEHGGFDALVLDVMLPDMDGFEVCRRVRATSQVPILMLTARGEDTDRIVGLELGADDYLPKPFNPRELLARLRAILRRGQPVGPSQPLQLHFGRLVIDHDTRSASLEGRRCNLTGHQFELLWALAHHAGRVLSREALMDAVRSESLEAFDRSIDVHISRIRSAIEDEPRKPRRIVTVRGAGYLFTKSQD